MSGLGRSGVDFNTAVHRGPDFTKEATGVELYDHTVDPGENTNRAGEHALASLQAQLSMMLHKGPLTGGAWGAWQTVNTTNL